MQRGDQGKIAQKVAGLSFGARTAGELDRSSNSLVRSKAQGKVPRLEIKNQTYEKLSQRHKLCFTLYIKIHMSSSLLLYNVCNFA